MSNLPKYIVVEKPTWDDITDAVREKLGEDDKYTTDEIAGKIRSIGTRDTLVEYLAEQVEDIVYYGDSIRASIFTNDTSVKTFEAPNLTSIPGAAFYNSKVRSIRCENVTTTIDAMQFDSCSFLSDIYLPRLSSMGGTACFRNCSALVNVELPSLKTLSGYQGFYKCSSLETVVLMSCTTISGGQAFMGCDAFKTLVIGTPNCTLSATSILPTGFLERGEIYLPDEAIDTYYKTATNWSYFAEIMKPISELSEGVITIW